MKKQMSPTVPEAPGTILEHVHNGVLAASELRDDCLNELVSKTVAAYRSFLIEEAIESGLSRASAENLVDFVWTRKGWPLVCADQLENIQGWTLN